MRSLALACVWFVACKEPARPEPPAAVEPAPAAQILKAEDPPAPLAVPADDHSVTYFKYTDAHGVTAIVDDLKAVPPELRSQAIKVQMPMGDAPSSAPVNPGVADPTQVWRALNPASLPPGETTAAPADPAVLEALQKAKDNVERWQAKQNEEQREIDKVMKSIK